MLGIKDMGLCIKSLCNVTRSRVVALRCVRTEVCSGEGKRFVNLFEEVLGSLQEEFRKRIKNLPILVEDDTPRVIL